MQRDEWKFQYQASQLAKAALEKRNHHEGRAEWWRKKQEEVLAEVKESGLEVTESIAAQYQTSSLAGAIGAARGAHIVVKNDYQQKLNECHAKIHSHAEKALKYDGWVQVLEANVKQVVELDIDDFLFFFGK